MRFMGNKAKLLDEIDLLLKDKKIDKKGLSFCDLFAGTCTVGDYFKDRYEIIANDTLYMSYVISNGKLKYNDKFFTSYNHDKRICTKFGWIYRYAYTHTFNINYNNWKYCICRNVTTNTAIYNNVYR